MILRLIVQSGGPVMCLLLPCLLMVPTAVVNRIILRTKS